MIPGTVAQVSIYTLYNARGRHPAAAFAGFGDDALKTETSVTAISAADVSSSDMKALISCEDKHAGQFPPTLFA
jgi:hypothetical protein